MRTRSSSAAAAIVRIGGDDGESPVAGLSRSAGQHVSRGIEAHARRQRSADALRPRVRSAAAAGVECDRTIRGADDAIRQ